MILLDILAIQRVAASMSLVLFFIQSSLFFCDLIWVHSGRIELHARIGLLLIRRRFTLGSLSAPLTVGGRINLLLVDAVRHRIVNEVSLDGSVHILIQLVLPLLVSNFLTNLIRSQRRCLLRFHIF